MTKQEIIDYFYENHVRGDFTIEEMAEDLATPTGEWKVYGTQGGIPITDYCSNCKYEMIWYKNKYNFCPKCGASMKNSSMEDLGSCYKGERENEQTTD